MQITFTAVPCLVRAKDSGMYYCRAKVHGRTIWRSLGTKVFFNAKAKLPDVLKELRNVPEAVEGSGLDSKSTFADAAKLFRASVESDPDIRDKATKMKGEALLRRCWPELFGMELRRVSPAACSDFMRRFQNGGSVYRINRTNTTRPGDSATSVNRARRYLAQVFRMALAAGAVSSNPALGLKRKRSAKKQLTLPSQEQWAAIVRHVRNQPGWGTKAADLMEGLAYSGMRVGESRRLTWGHVDFASRMLRIPGTKTASSVRTEDLNGQMEELLVHMMSGRAPPHDERVFTVDECLGSLAAGCRAANVQKMVHQDLRHLFATRCLQAGVDPHTVAQWLGHNDGGQLVLKTYAEFCRPHAAEMAKKVKI
jgi:integrase